MTIATARALILCALFAGAPNAWTASDLEGQKPAGQADAVKERTRPAKMRVVNPGAKVKMTFEQKLEVYNRAKPADEKLYCRRDTVTGSHKKKMRCITMRAKRDEEEAARRFLRAVR